MSWEDVPTQNRVWSTQLALWRGWRRRRLEPPHRGNLPSLQGSRHRWDVGSKGLALVVIALCPQDARGLGFPPDRATAVLGRGANAGGLGPLSCCRHTHGSGAK